ncbi:MAG TPA: hypothetical protein DD803_16050 [Alcaligenes faecalis]|nr:hypothetical protein [Alcaligenes faecalis]HBQ90949.1 hypothetical protein [Alcaligenes faecalis]
MKTRLEILLGEWGCWKQKENVRALGLPPSSVYARERVDGAQMVEPSVLLVDDDLMRVDRAVDALHPDMKVVVIAHYIWQGLVKVKADRLGISRTVYYRHIEFAHKQLASTLGGAYSRGYEQNYFVPTHCLSVGTQVL